MDYIHNEELIDPLQSLSIVAKGSVEAIGDEKENNTYKESHSEPDAMNETFRGLSIEPESLSYKDVLLMNKDMNENIKTSLGATEADGKRMRAWPKPKIVVKRVKRENLSEEPSHEIDVFDGAEDDGMNDIWYRLNVDKLSQILIRSRSNLSVKQKAQKDKRIAAK